jgi:hypothetical protein
MFKNNMGRYGFNFFLLVGEKSRLFTVIRPIVADWVWTGLTHKHAYPSQTGATECGHSRRGADPMDCRAARTRERWRRGPVRVRGKTGGK